MARTVCMSELGAGGSLQPNCLTCRHYYVTHDPRQPRGCKAYGFKSRDLPNRVVRSVSGQPCQLHAVR